MLGINRPALLLTIVFAMQFAAGSARTQTLPFSPEAERRAAALLKQMTLEEKIGQLNQGFDIQFPGLPPSKPDASIMEGKTGSILWLTDIKDINRLQHMTVEKSRLHIPILFGLDVIHGYRTVFPVPLAMASSWDPSVEEQAQQIAAEDARAAGIQWTFAPMIDIARDARWGRIVEGGGEDAYLGAAMARAQVRGFQGASLGPSSCSPARSISRDTAQQTAAAITIRLMFLRNSCATSICRHFTLPSGRASALLCRPTWT